MTGHLDLEPGRPDAGLAELALRDPGFDQAQFLGFAEAAYRRVRAAHGAGDIEQARDLLDADLLTTLANQLAFGATEGVRRWVVTAHALRSEFSGCWLSMGDRLQVRFTVLGDVTDRDLTGVPIEPRVAREWHEYWTFVRFERDHTAAPETCTRCGGPTPPWGGPCEHCDAFVRSPFGVWRITELMSMA